MQTRIFPEKLNNQYYGTRIAILILLMVTIVKFLMGLNIGGFNPLISSEYILSHVDGIPLNTYPIEAEKYIVSMAQSWGLILLILSLFSFLVLVRYRAFIPLMFCIYLFENIAHQITPLARAIQKLLLGQNIAMASAINLGLVTLLIIGLILSVYNPFAKADKARN